LSGRRNASDPRLKVRAYSRRRRAGRDVLTQLMLHCARLGKVAIWSTLRERGQPGAEPRAARWLAALQFEGKRCSLAGRPKGGDLRPGRRPRPWYIASRWCSPQRLPGGHRPQKWAPAYARP